MPPKSKTTLSDSQKYEFCLFANTNKMTRKEYVDWIEQKWGDKVNESTRTRICKKRILKLPILMSKDIKI